MTKILNDLLHHLPIDDLLKGREVFHKSIHFTGIHLLHGDTNLRLGHIPGHRQILTIVFLDLQIQTVDLQETMMITIVIVIVEETLGAADMIETDDILVIDIEKGMTMIVVVEGIDRVEDRTNFLKVIFIVL